MSQDKSSDESSIANDNLYFTNLISKNETESLDGIEAILNDHLPIAFRTRSKVCIRENMDTLLEILSDPQEGIPKSKVWCSLLTTIKNDTKILDDENDPFSIGEEVHSEVYDIGSVTKKELALLQPEKRPCSPPVTKEPSLVSVNKDCLSPEQINLLKIQMTMSVQLAVQLCMIGSNTPDCDLIEIVFTCLTMLTELSDVCPVGCPWRPDNLDEARNMLVAENVYQLCPSKYDELLAHEIVKVGTVTPKFFNTAYKQRLMFTHMDLLASKPHVFPFPHLFMTGYPLQIKNNRRILRSDEICLLAIGINACKGSRTWRFQDLRDRYLTYMDVAHISASIRRLGKSRSKPIRANAVKFLRKFNHLPCFTTNCKLYSLSIPPADYIWQLHNKGRLDWLNIYLTICLFIKDHELFTAHPHHFITSGNINQLSLSKIDWTTFFAYKDTFSVDALRETIIDKMNSDMSSRFSRCI